MSKGSSKTKGCRSLLQIAPMGGGGFRELSQGGCGTEKSSVGLNFGGEPLLVVMQQL